MLVLAVSCVKFAAIFTYLMMQFSRPAAFRSALNVGTAVAMLIVSLALFVTQRMRRPQYDKDY